MKAEVRKVTLTLEEDLLEKVHLEKARSAGRAKLNEIINDRLRESYKARPVDGPGTPRRRQAARA